MLGIAGRGRKAQISLEFLIVYSFVLTIFVIMFALISTQRAASLVQQQYALLQSQAQAISTYINQAASAGSGYSATVPLLGGFVTHAYNISISNTGAIILSTKYGTQPITAYAFSNAKSFVINGTVVNTANGISIYQLQTFTGAISIYNSKGIIYIDQQPVSTANLAQGVLTTQQGNVRAALFNGQTSVISSSWLANTPLEFLPSYTITGWVYLNGYGNTYSIIYGEGVPQGTLFFSVYNGVSSDCLDSGEWSLSYSGHWILWCSGLTIPLHQWVFVAETLANGAVGSGTVTLYSSSPSFQYQTGPGQAESDAGINTIAIGMNPGQFAASPYMYQFNGLVSDIQLYNSTLSPSQVQGIYQEGMGGAPLMSANLIGYWPLNGNGNDYSGHAYVGVPNSVSYQSAIQLNSLLLPASNSVVKPIAGFVASAGNLGANGLSAVSAPDGNSIARAFLSSNGAFGSANVVTDYFNGNLSTEGNLIAWWPLDTGYGNAIYDLSGHYNNGAFINGVWSSVNRTNFAAALFPGNPTGASGSNTQDGFITVNSAQSLLSVGANSTFTAVGWIYYKGATSSPSHMQGIFGDLPNWPATGAGFQLVGYGDGGGAVLYINGSSVPFPGSTNSFPPNSWEMITAEYNGSTGQANVYLNNTLFASNALPKGLGLVQTKSLYIGDDAWQTGGIDSFNGLITNLQFYYSYLTPSQISALYAQGPTSTPLGDAGLISWWPLSGNANDYSLNNNEGAINYNVIFQNGNYTSNIAKKGQTQSFVTFNGAPGCVSLGKSAYGLGITQYATFTGWVDPASLALPALLISDWQGNEGMTLRIDSPSSATFYVYGGNVQIGRIQAPYAFSTNTWYQLTGVMNGANMYLYINGVQVGSTALGANIGSSSQTLKIGTSGGGCGVQSAIGSIADVQIYNTALTQQQIMQLYTQGFPPQSRLNVSLG
jgi:hypothetical protein